MSPIPRHSVIQFSLIALILAGMIAACQGHVSKTTRKLELPYPDSAMAVFLQSRVDSSEFEWFTDVKAAASAFLNETMYAGKEISATNIIILGEGLFHARVEVDTDSRTLILTMERPFKQRGRKSIWQVVKVEEKQWPDSRSR